MQCFPGIGGRECKNFRSTIALKIKFRSSNADSNRYKILQNLNIIEQNDCLFYQRESFNITVFRNLAEIFTVKRTKIFLYL